MIKDHMLLLVAVGAGVINALGSVFRTLWHFEKRRAWKAKVSEE